MKISELQPFDAVEVLTDDEPSRHYLSLAFEDGDPRMIQMALGTVARVRGIGAVAQAVSMSPEELCDALSDAGTPKFSTILKAVDALALRLTIVPRATPASHSVARPHHA